MKGLHDIMFDIDSKRNHFKQHIPSFVSNLAGECVLLRSVTRTEKKLSLLKQQTAQQL